MLAGPFSYLSIRDGSQTQSFVLRFEANALGYLYPLSGSVHYTTIYKICYILYTYLGIYAFILMLSDNDTQHTPFFKGRKSGPPGVRLSVAPARHWDTCSSNPGVRRRDFFPFFGPFLLYHIVC